MSLRAPRSNLGSNVIASAAKQSRERCFSLNDGDFGGWQKSPLEKISRKVLIHNELCKFMVDRSCHTDNFSQQV